MFAVTAARQDADDPLSGLDLVERREPEVPDGWTSVEVRAASLNHHDLWSLRGVGLAEERLSMILGCAAARVDAEGHDVVVHAVVSSPDWCSSWAPIRPSSRGRGCPSASTRSWRRWGRPRGVTRCARCAPGGGSSSRGPRAALERGVRPVIHETMALSEARAGFEAMAAGELLGKVVFRV